MGGPIPCRSLTDPISFVEESLALPLPLSVLYLFFSIFLLIVSLCSIRTDLCSRDPIPQISLRSELQHLLARPRLRLQPNRLSAFLSLSLYSDISLSTFRLRSLYISFPISPVRESTAKVSSLLVPRARAISFPPEVNDASPQRLTPNNNMDHTKSGRRRRSSSIIYQEPAESLEHTSDQAALPNLNANWVNAKG